MYTNSRSIDFVDQANTLARGMQHHVFGDALGYATLCHPTLKIIRDVRHFCLAFHLKTIMERNQKAAHATGLGIAFSKWVLNECTW